MSLEAEAGDAHHLKRSGSGNGSGYLLTGLVVCQRCGRRFVGAAANGKRYRYPWRLNEMLFAERIEALASEVDQLKARRSELEEEISAAGRPEVLAPEDLAGLREEVWHVLRSGPLPERKALMQTLVAEIRMRDRSWIQPVFKVPVFRPPYGLVVPTGFEPVSPP